MKTINSLSALLLFSVFATAQPTQPAAPPACNSSDCTPPLSENCASGSTVVTNFINPTLRAGSANSVGAVYSFYNVATVSGQQINATVTIDAASNVSMSGSDFSIDDNTATDQDGNSIAGFFAPRITPDQILTNTDRRGYVQFTIRFYMENGTAGQQYPGDFTTLQPLTGLNYIHYDIDGNPCENGSGGWFRETGVVQDVVGSMINANVPTELVSYTYTDGSNWKGFAGSVCERPGVSRCAEVAVAANYLTAQSTITFRMGYDYNYTTSGFNIQPTRQYGSRFGCFEFPLQGTLPVKFLSFTAQRIRSNVNLSWATTTEENNSGFVVQRSIGNGEWENVGYVASRSANGNSSVVLSYQFTDINPAKGITQYRLNQLDIDGRSSYSSIRSVRGEEQKSKTIIYPNPSNDGKVSVVFEESNTIRNVSLMDMNGRIIKQWKGVTNNTIQIDNLAPGFYTVRMVNTETGEQVVEKVVVNKR